ncbi:MAG: hypothetical protein WC979_05405 [Candidatus Pacearchaeota archaeon]|jgi:hypothetical protein
MTNNSQKQQDISIVNELISHAHGKLCSRYVLGLERARDSIDEGSSENALKEQRDWVKEIEKSKRSKKK